MALSLENVSRLLETLLATKSVRTVFMYKHGLDYFAKFMGCASIEQAVCDFLNAGADGALEHARRYAQDMKDSCCTATANHRLSILRNLAAYAAKMNYIDWQPQGYVQ